MERCTQTVLTLKCLKKPLRKTAETQTLPMPEQATGANDSGFDETLFQVASEAEMADSYLNRDIFRFEQSAGTERKRLHRGQSRKKQDQQNSNTRHSNPNILESRREDNTDDDASYMTPHDLSTVKKVRQAIKKKKRRLLSLSKQQMEIKRQREKHQRGVYMNKWNLTNKKQSLKYLDMNSGLKRKLEKAKLDALHLVRHSYNVSTDIPTLRERTDTSAEACNSRQTNIHELSSKKNSPLRTSSLYPCKRKDTRNTHTKLNFLHKRYGSVMQSQVQAHRQHCVSHSMNFASVLTHED